MDSVIIDLILKVKRYFTLNQKSSLILTNTSESNDFLEGLLNFAIASSSFNSLY